MIKEEGNRFPASLEEAKRLVEREFLGTGGIHGVGKKASKNAVRVYASGESPALEAVLSDIKSRCEPFDIDVIIEQQPLAAPPTEITAEQADEPGPE